MEPRWTREKVLEGIRRRAKSGPLWFRHLRRDDRSLLSAARRFFGRWSLALKAAGVPIYWRTNNPGPTKYTEEIITGILKAARARGDIRIDPLRRKHVGIYRAAVRIFGGWPQALKAAGIHAHRGQSGYSPSLR